MFTNDHHFYFISALPQPSLAQQAKDHGELNEHIVRVEDLLGNALWERKPENEQ
jgi:hypothetical protein